MQCTQELCFGSMIQSHSQEEDILGVKGISVPFPGHNKVHHVLSLQETMSLSHMTIDRYMLFLICSLGSRSFLHRVLAVLLATRLNPGLLPTVCGCSLP